MGRESKIKKLRREGILEPVKMDKKRASALKKIFLWTTSLLLSFVLVFGVWAYVAKDIQASVNGMRIFTKDVEEMLDPVKRSMQQQGLNPDDESQIPTINQYRSEIIEMLIDMKLVEQYAKKNGISVPEAEIESRIDQEIQQIRSSYETEEEFIKVLASSELRNINALREEIRKNLEGQLLEEKIFASSFEEIVFTEEDALEYFESPSLIQVQRILLQVDFENDPQELIDTKEAEIKDIREKLLKEEITFENAVELHSDDKASKPNNGEMSLQELSPPNEPELFETAKAMQLGETSSIIRTEYGFSIIKVNGISYHKERYDTPESAKIKALTLKDQETPPDPLVETQPSNQERAEGLVNTLRQGKEKFDTIADLYAISPENSKLEQTVYRGQMDPAKETIIFDQLNPGEISDPIPSADTFEIIMLIEKSPPEKADFNKIKDQLIEEITMRKKAEIRNQWLSEQREKAKISRSNPWIRISDFFQSKFGGFFEDFANWVRHYTVEPEKITVPDGQNGEIPINFPGDGSGFEGMEGFDETFTIPVDAEDFPIQVDQENLP